MGRPEVEAARTAAGRLLEARGFRREPDPRDALSRWLPFTALPTPTRTLVWMRGEVEDRALDLVATNFKGSIEIRPGTVLFAIDGARFEPEGIGATVAHARAIATCSPPPVTGAFR